MAWIPGWTSAAGAEWWSGFYFWLSISCLIGLGITEVASHRYGERKDELAVIEQAAKDKRHDEDMARVQHDTAQANERAAQLSWEAAEATKAAAQANKHSAELKLALEREVAARQPRTISPQQHDAIVAYLKDVSPKEPITVVWKLFDEEAEKFGRQIIAVLTDSGFPVTEGRGPFGFGERGAWIVVKDLEKVKAAPTAIGAVQGAFRDILHIQFDGGERKEGYPDVDLTIAIGAKP